MSTLTSKLLVLLTLVSLSACVNIPRLDAGDDTGSAVDSPTNGSPDSADVPTNVALDVIDAATGDGSETGAPSDDANDGSSSDGGGSMDALDGQSMDALDAADARVDVPDTSIDSPTCMGGQARCGAMCVDLQSNALHCGMCGSACVGAQVCDSGECRCPGASVACGVACVDTSSDPNNCGRCGNTCPAGIGCMGGLCRCPMNGVVCNGMCVDTQINGMNCGACGNVCPAGQICAGGSCGCAAPTSLCAGSCVNLQSSNNNCGACANRCPAGTSCNGGACTCPGGATYCPATMTCSVLANDPMNCGMCGNACPAAQSCVNGSCQCPGGNPTLCGAACVNSQSSNANCGMCGNACPAAQSCVSGVCSCPVGLPNLCGANCVNRQTDRNNCGACGTSCRADQSCVGGACSCPGGQTDCNNVCVSLQTNNAHCGMCNNACGVAQSCAAAVCTCPAGQTACGANCVTLTNDRNNCGMCARACTASQVCAASNCRCPVGTADCSGTGMCIDITADIANCGGCANACPAVPNATRTCVSSACSFQCDAGFADCDGMPANGCETNTNSSVNNCGGCGIQCTTGMCIGGVCQEWARRVGGVTGGERGYDVASDGDGNTYFVGAFAGTMTVAPGVTFNANGNGGYLLSYSPTGNYRWGRVIDGAQNDEMLSVAASGQGANARVVIAGTAGTAVNMGGGVIGGAGFQGVFAAYTGGGVHIWSTFATCGGNVAVAPDDIALGPNNEVYATGFHYGVLQMQGNSVMGPSAGIGFLLKLNAMGTFQWGRVFGQNSFQSTGTGVAVDPFGDVYVTALVGSINDYGGGPRGTMNQQQDMLIAKYDSNNNHIWSEVYGGSINYQWPDSIAINPITNDVTVAGVFQNALDFGGGPLANPLLQNVFIATFNSAGAAGRPVHLRSVSYGNGVGPGFGAHQAIVFSPGGRLFLTTTYSSVVVSFGGLPVAGGFGQKGLVADINVGTLAVIAVTGFANAGGTTYASSIASCLGNYVCLTGHYGPTITFNNTTLTNLGGGSDYDSYLVRLLRP